MDLPAFVDKETLYGGVGGGGKGGGGKGVRGNLLQSRYEAEKKKTHQKLHKMHLKNKQTNLLTAVAAVSRQTFI